MTIQLIDGGVSAVAKTWSARLAMVTGFVTALEQALPPLAALLPPAWQAYAAVGIIIARAIRQVQQPVSLGNGEATKHG